MSLLEVVLVGIGLSMDAVAVSMSNGMVYKCADRKKLLAMPLFFGIFQALMPLAGYFAGGLFADIITKYSGIVIFLILGFIGGKMIKDGFCHSDECECEKTSLTYKLLFAQAIATSIDAFAVGVGFAAGAMPTADIFYSVFLIGIITFLLSMWAIFIGKRFGNMLGSKAEILGGVILVIIGIKSLLPF